MRALKDRLFDWLDHRTGLETAIKDLLYHEIPGSSSWHQVFGSVAIFLFLVQAFTGILLAFNYAPTPGDAYYSVRYIVTQTAAGQLIHGLHHWGATLMIVVVVVHMAQVFVYGAYKKPREATWMVGVVLLLLTLAFGLTGYLLPWDNRAYWGTVVTTQIAGHAPLVGQYMDRLLGTQSGGGVGVVTFARFFALHVLILAPLMGILVVFHVHLVRKHGAAPTPGDTLPPKRFYPEQVLRDAIATFIAFVLLYAMALFAQVPLERLADPTDTTYIPRPDWYFLFLFQLLKFFKGSLEPIGSVVLPNLAILLLFLIPFVDRKKVMKLTQRVTAFGIVVFAAVAWTALTVAAIKTTPKSPEVPAASPAREWVGLSPDELAGIGYYRAESCSGCHNLIEGSPKVGPNLAGVGQHRTATWMIAHFKNPSGVIPGSPMPPLQLSDAQLNTLAAFLLKLTPTNAEALASTPQWAVQGAQLFVDRGCGLCHTVNGVGTNLGPPLNGVAQRHTRDWLEKHFENPQALSPGSTMPPFRFSADEMKNITSYLLALPSS